MLKKKRKKENDSPEDTDIEEDVDSAENTVGQTSTTENTEYTLQRQNAMSHSELKALK